MHTYGDPVAVLMVDDDPADVELTLMALEETKLINDFQTVKDGEECLRYLRRQGDFKDAKRPDLILLDLNMPRMNGIETLKAIRSDPTFDTIPVVVLTTSDDEQDIVQSYKLHANCYVRKPVDLDQFMKAVQSIEEFWVAVVRLPPKK